MALDQELLHKAQDAGKRLAEAERQALLARGDYHTIIRLLHLAGGSLREIAEGLGLSHQRIGQIVDDGGGSWWRKVWRTRKVTRDMVCTFCGKPPSEVEKIIAGPNVFICDTCVDLAEQRLTRGAGAFTVAKDGAKCSFCSKRRSAERPVVASAEARVCRVCLTQCRQILDDRSDRGSP